MRLLLDEHISPALVSRLAEMGVYAQSVPHVGLAGRTDHTVWMALQLLPFLLSRISWE